MKNDDHKTILITGAGGFLGSTLVERILEKNYQLILFTSQKDKYTSLDQIIVHDNLDWEKNRIDFSQVDILVNCAFARSSDPVQIANSINFTNDFIGDAVSKGCKSVINVSTQSVYDQERLESARENTIVRPQTLYGMAKYATECIVSRISVDYQVPYSNLRLGSLIGLDFNIRLVNRFIQNAINNEPINIIGGEQIISYMDVRDAADGIEAMLNINSRSWKTVYNFGAKESLPITKVADMVKRIAANFISSPVIVNREAGGGSLNLSLDSSSFYKDISWEPKYNMERFIKEKFQISIDE